MSSSIKLIILAVIFMCIGCGQAKDPGTQKQTNPNSPPKLDSPSAEIADAQQFDASKVQLKGPGKVLKKSYGEWKMATAPRYFGPDNLYDLINGGSEIFVAYGFQQIVTTDYRNAAHANKTITAEIYDMKTPIGAFGRVSKYLENMSNPKDAGKGLSEAMAPYSLLGDGDLIFWRGRHIVHLLLMDEDPAATPDSIAEFSNKTIPVIGETIFNELEETAPLEMLSIFPTESLILRSHAYHYDFEVGGIKNSAYTARYQNGDISWTLFVTPPAIHGGTANANFYTIAQKTKDCMEVRRYGNFVMGAQVDVDAKPDAKKLKQQLDMLQDALKKLNDQNRK